MTTPQSSKRVKISTFYYKAFTQSFGIWEKMPVKKILLANKNWQS